LKLTDPDLNFQRGITEVHLDLNIPSAHAAAMRCHPRGGNTNVSSPQWRSHCPPKREDACPGQQ
jgi:hypothetical protein